MKECLCTREIPGLPFDSGKIYSVFRKGYFYYYVIGNDNQEHKFKTEDYVRHFKDL